jgi:hypothetical protein
VLQLVERSGDDADDFAAVGFAGPRALAQLDEQYTVTDRGLWMVGICVMIVSSWRGGVAVLTQGLCTGQRLTIIRMAGLWTEWSGSRSADIHIVRSKTRLADDSVGDRV